MTRHYWCKTCEVRISETVTHKAFQETTREGSCPKGHPVKLIPLVSYPCPLCGEKGYHNYRGEPKAWREEGMPCSNCTREFSDLKKFRDDTLAKQQDLQPHRILNYPTLPYSSYVAWPHGHRASDAFRDMLLVLAASEPNPGHELREIPIVPYAKEEYIGSVRADAQVRMSEAQAAAIQLFYERIINQLEVAYRKGKEDGEAFITRMASGDISYSEMELEARLDHVDQITNRVVDVATNDVVARKRLKPEEMEKFKSNIRSVLLRE